MGSSVDGKICWQGGNFRILAKLSRNVRILTSVKVTRLVCLSLHPPHLYNRTHRYAFHEKLMAEEEVLGQEMCLADTVGKTRFVA